MSSSKHGQEAIEELWRARFGEPPPVRTSLEMTRRVLASFDHVPCARLSAEALALEREAERGSEALRAARARSAALMAEARVLAGLRPAGGR
jgi:hypothetical protein